MRGDALNSSELLKWVWFITLEFFEEVFGESIYVAALIISTALFDFTTVLRLLSLLTLDYSLYLIDNYNYLFFNEGLRWKFLFQTRASYQLRLLLSDFFKGSDLYRLRERSRGASSSFYFWWVFLGCVCWSWCWFLSHVSFSAELLIN